MNRRIRSRRRLAKHKINKEQQLKNSPNFNDESFQLSNDFHSSDCDCHSSDCSSDCGGGGDFGGGGASGDW